MSVQGGYTPSNESIWCLEQSWTDKSRATRHICTQRTHSVVPPGRHLVRLAYPVRNPRIVLPAQHQLAPDYCTSPARALRGQEHANTHCPTRTVGSKREGEQVRAESGCAACNSRSRKRSSTIHGTNKAADAFDLARAKKKRCSNSKTTNEGLKGGD